MEVLKAREQYLTNAESASAVQEQQETLSNQRKTQSNGVLGHQKNLSTILYEVEQYLKGTANAPATMMSREQACALAEVLRPYNLTKAEFLQIVNNRPRTPIELQLIIEDMESRITSDEEIEKVLTLVAEHIALQLPPPPQATESSKKQKRKQRREQLKMEKEAALKSSVSVKKEEQ